MNFLFKSSFILLHILLSIQFKCGHTMISVAFNKTPNKAFNDSNTSQYLTALIHANNRFHCMGGCNKMMTQCALVSYNRDTKVCSMYLASNDDLVQSTNTDVFSKTHISTLCNYKIVFSFF